MSLDKISSSFLKNFSNAGISGGNSHPQFGTNVQKTGGLTGQSGVQNVGNSKWSSNALQNVSNTNGELTPNYGTSGLNLPNGGVAGRKLNFMC